MCIRDRVNPGDPGRTKDELAEPALTQLCPQTMPKGTPNGAFGVPFGGIVGFCTIPEAILGGFR
eukprot:4171097-Pyramimonas_sp.AAC.1